MQKFSNSVTNLSGHLPLVIIVILMALLQYFFYFRSGYLILGGEGNYWTDYKTYIDKSATAWNGYSIGAPATSIGAFFTFAIIMDLINSVRIQSFIIALTLHALPLIFTYLLLLEFRYVSKKIALVVALTYILNPFSMTFLYSLNPWGAHILYAYPLYLLTILKNYHINKRLFFIFGTITAITAYVFTNPPQMILLILGFTIFTISSQLILFNKLKIRELLTKLAVIYGSFIVFNLWWIVHWIIILPDASKNYSYSFAENWLFLVSAANFRIMKDTFSMSWNNNGGLDFNFFNWYYNIWLVKVILFIPFAVVFYWLAKKSRSSKKKIIFFLLLNICLIILLFKGANRPFPGIILRCFKYVPYCYLFKTTPEKFGLPLVFTLFLSLPFILNDIKSKFISSSILLYTLVLAVPFLIGQQIPDYKLGGNIFTRKIKPAVISPDFINEMKGEPTDLRLISLPANGNYAVKLLADGKYYHGMDPILNNIPQSFIYDDPGIVHKNELYSSLRSEAYGKLLGLYSVRYIYFNRQLEPWENDTRIRDRNIIAGKFPLKKKYKDIWLYENPNYLPLFYTSDKVIYASPGEKILPVLQQFPDAKKPAIYRSNDRNFYTEKAVDEKINNIKYRKLSFAKYHLTVATNDKSLPLIFSTSYHSLWKIYKIPYGSVNDVETLFAGTGLNANVKPMKQAPHMLVNDYANGWMLDVKKICSDEKYCFTDENNTQHFKLIVEFIPQQILKITSAVSAVAFFTGVLIYLRGFIKSKLKKNNV